MTEGIETAFAQLADESRPVRSIDLHPLSDVPRERIDEFRGMWRSLLPERRLELLREMVEQAETHVDLNFQRRVPQGPDPAFHLLA